MAVWRELREETGLGDNVGSRDLRHDQPFPISPPWRHRYAPDVVENIEHVFRVRPAERPPITLNPAEHSEYRWLVRAVAATQVTSYTNREAISCLP